MMREELAELHFITAIDNVPSIVRHGILSHARTSRVEHVSVAMPEIQQRRQNKVVPGGRPLHDYANLYINARNKMMYRVKSKCGHEGICVLRISPAILELPGVVIADENASSDYVRFARAPDGLKHIDQATVFADSCDTPRGSDHGVASRFGYVCRSACARPGAARIYRRSVCFV